MGILDSLMKNPELLGDVAKFAGDNPQIAKAAMNMFSSSQGNGGGISEILGSLSSGGLDDIVSSWLGGGDNKAVDPGKLTEALGSDRVSQFANEAGVSASEAGTLLAGFLPTVVDKLSPDGKLPDAGNLNDVIGGLLGGLKG